MGPLAVLLLCLGGCLYAYWVVLKWRVTRDGMLGPWPWPVFGNLFSALWNLKTLHKMVNRRYTHYGYTFRVWLGMTPVVIMYHPKEVKRVFVTEQQKYDRSTLEQQALWRLLNGGLLMQSNGEEWKRTREMLAPAFHRKSLREMIPLFTEKADLLAENLRAAIGRGSDGRQGRVDMQTEFQKLTFDVIGVVAMQFEFQSQTQEGENAYEQAWEVVLNQMMLQFYFPVPYSFWRFLYRLPIPAMGRFNHSIAILESGIYAAIDHRKQTGVREDDSDFLACMLRKQEEELAEGTPASQLRISDERIKNELLTFMFAGHDTTRSTMTWILYYIATHADVEERVVAELREVYGSSTQAVDIDLSQLKYLRQVLKETLRRRPPAPVRGRTLNEDDTIDGYHLAKGSNLSLSPYITQNNARIWKDPKRFDPSRFDEGAPAYDPYSYFPFGAGPRRCIGEQMAIYEILSVVSMLLLQFKFTVIPGAVIEDEWALTLSMTNGLPMSVEVRASLQSLNGQT